MNTKTIKKQLEKQLGKGKVFTEKEYLIAYSYDATGSEHPPDLVVLPENEADLQHTLEIAFNNKIPVTPRGAGVGYSGGSIPLNGGIALVFTKMNRILSIDTENFTAEVEPGVITYDLQQEAGKHGLFYPPDPASLKTSTMGGNVAENAGGLRCFKYGVTGNYVLGLEAFLINGKKMKFGGPIIKDVAGYDIKSLLTGSEGTLAVISKIILKLIPQPPARRLFRIDFNSLEKGAMFINRMINANIGPSILEFMDRTSLFAVSQYQGVELPGDIQAAVLMEIDGTETELEDRQKRFDQLVRDKTCGIISYETAETKEQQEKLWDTRRNISPAIAKLKPKKINEDIVVPVAKIPGAVDYINSVAKEHDILIVMFGHFGDGNIHTNVMIDPANADEMKRAETALDKIFRFVVSVNGSITGEHGVGTAKKPFMKYMFNENEINLFRAVKHAFDPENLLNPGKIF